MKEKKPRVTPFHNLNVTFRDIVSPLDLRKFIRSSCKEYNLAPKLKKTPPPRFVVKSSEELHLEKLQLNYFLTAAAKARAATVALSERIAHESLHGDEK